jgi:HAD superfamily phosphatase (TIGR01668 family)
MLRRILYALAQARQQRSALRRVNHEPSQQVASILQLDYTAAYQRGIRVLALDFDGVLAAHGNIMPLPELTPWLQACVAQFGAGRVCILSNNPIPARVEYFNQHCPGIEYIKSPRKKPYPDGVQAICLHLKVSPKEVLVVDDRLLTGVLAAIIAGAEVAYITQPYIGWQQRPIVEAFFASLRYLERNFF